MAKLRFGGDEYEYVEFNTITLDEALILHQYSGLNLDEVPDAGFHPGVIMALIHITVARGNPNINAKDLRAAVGQTTYAELNQIFEDVSVEVEEAAEADRPPASPAPSGDENANDGPTNLRSLDGISGGSGDTSSENQDEPPQAIGSPG